MTQPLLIAIVLAIFLHEALGLVLPIPRPGAAAALGFALGPQIGLILAVHLRIRLAAVALERTGDVGQVKLAESLLTVSRIGAVIIHAVSVLALGLLEAIRSITGDLILIDEALACAPPLAVFVFGWVSFYPIDRLLREASILRAIEEGDHVYPPRTLPQFILDNVRHALLITLVPLAAIVGASEAIVRYGPRLGVASPDLLSAIQLLCVLLVLVLSPIALRFIWSTVPLAPGPLRDRLADMCARHNVRFRDILVWRTHGSMINGAVMGLLPQARYVLLTDALLDRLPDAQVEAVMAHEIAHVRRRHLPWMLAALASAIGLTTLAASVAIEAAARAVPDLGAQALAPLAETLSLAVSVALALSIFGFVSRRFEWQADAFAVQHLSGMTARNGGRNVTITGEASGAMIDALDSVAHLNLVPRRKRFWRHGSIAHRQSRLARLAGAPARALPIDREVRRIKRATALALLLLIAAIALLAVFA